MNKFFLKSFLPIVKFDPSNKSIKEKVHYLKVSELIAITSLK